MNGRRAAGLIDAARLDPAGALAGAADACSRRGFIAMAGAGALALALPAAASAKDAAANDTAILNFALTLEYLQAAFYTEAERLNALTGQSAATARQLGAVERAHATALQQALRATVAGRGRTNPVRATSARASASAIGSSRAPAVPTNRSSSSVAPWKSKNGRGLALSPSACCRAVAATAPPLPASAQPVSATAVAAANARPVAAAMRALGVRPLTP